MTIRRRLYRLIQRCYNHCLRPHLRQRKWIWNNGVPAPTGRLLDRRSERHWAKAGTVDALRRFVKPTDHITVIGQNFGVTAVVAARRGHRVTVYEAAGERVAYLRDYFERLKIDDKVTVRHRVVGDAAIDVYGVDIGPPLFADALPPTDVIEIDAEGAELDILSQLTRPPRVLIVEPHPEHGATVEEIETRCRSLGYDTVFVNEPAPGYQSAVVALTPDRTVV